MTDYRLLTVQQTADMLALTPRTLYRWRGARRRPAVVAGRPAIRYRYADVAAWLEDGGRIVPARRRVGRPRSA